METVQRCTKGGRAKQEDAGGGEGARTRQAMRGPIEDFKAAAWNKGSCSPGVRVLKD